MKHLYKASRTTNYQFRYTQSPNQENKKTPDDPPKPPKKPNPNYPNPKNPHFIHSHHTNHQSLSSPASPKQQNELIPIINILLRRPPILLGISLLSLILQGTNSRHVCQPQSSRSPETGANSARTQIDAHVPSSSAERKDKANHARRAERSGTCTSVVSDMGVKRRKVGLPDALLRPFEVAFCLSGCAEAFCEICARAFQAALG
jgi:hypothetical protein